MTIKEFFSNKTIILSILFIILLLVILIIGIQYGKAISENKDLKTKDKERILVIQQQKKIIDSSLNNINNKVDSIGIYNTLAEQEHKNGEIIHKESNKVSYELKDKINQVDGATIADNVKQLYILAAEFRDSTNR